MIHPSLFIAKTKTKGRGVFTRDALEANTLLEIAPVIVLNEEERKLIDKTALYDYYFCWGDEQQEAAIPLGWAGIYNHDKDANCRYETYFETKEIHILSVRNIAAGEELCINYNFDEEGESIIWFEESEN